MLLTFGVASIRAGNGIRELALRYPVRCHQGVSMFRQLDSRGNDFFEHEM